ncbi:MAG: carbohydrate ABC transporter permease [Candidatus Avoscillospira sp.]
MKNDMRRKRGLVNSLFLAPALIFFTAFTYYPLLCNIYYSLTSWNGVSAEKEFVGLQNYVTLFHDKLMLQSVGNTAYFAVVLLVMGLILQLGSALILYSKPKGHGVIKVLLYLPAVLSPIVLSFTWIQFLQYTGYVNQLLEAINQTDLCRSWLLSEKDVKFWLCVIQSLQYAGYGMIFFLTGLNGVPKEVLEAADLDGAVGIKKFMYVTLPLIMPSVTVSLFISITGALNTYAIPFALTGGGPNGASTTITMMIKSKAFGFRQMGYACAISMVFFVFIAIVTGIQLHLTRSREVEY